MARETRYAKSDGLGIAYQVVGHGEFDLVFVMGWVSHVEFSWTEPYFARFFNRLASFSRLILFDKRGTGMSDRPAELPTLEQRMDDVRAVMDAAGSEKAVLFGISEGGPMCLLFAATYPERTRAVVVDGAYARSMWAPDYPWGRSEEQRDRRFQFLGDNWGSDILLDARAPTLAADDDFREWWSTYLRMSASPGAAVALSRMNWQIDIRDVLQAISVPTLVMHRRGDKAIGVEHGRYLAEHIPGAHHVEFPGADHIPFSGDQDAILDEVERFLTGTVPSPAPNRILATLLFMEIVGAVGMAARLGDAGWAELLGHFDREAAESLVQFRGRMANRTTAGLVASFDGPARAIRCAATIIERSNAMGLSVRAGLHTGECELRDGELGGVAVQIASRVMARSRSGEVVVSRTVADLVTGSGISFERQEHRLPTGGGQAIDLYRVIDAFGRPGQPAASPADVPKGHPPLTAREHEVAVLVGRGFSNRTVAETLSISVATVERHIANIFNKLGVHSRTQIATWVVAEGLAEFGPGATE